jgi:hypothetical protein
MMAYSEVLADWTVAISVSESPDLGALGMTDAHLRDATAELARHLLALGARIAYGGDLRAGGFTEILFELVARHRRDADEGDQRSAVLSYLAWPVHISKPVYELERYASELEGIADLLMLDADGIPLSRDRRRQLGCRPADPAEWAMGLTAMRRLMNRDTSARIVAGGKLEGFLGAMPGIAEEARIALENGQPLYVLGGFGGCAADVAAAIGIAEVTGIPSRDWGQADIFVGAQETSLHNGLIAEENRTLAITPHVDEAIALVLRGMVRLHRGVAQL